MASENVLQVIDLCKSFHKLEVLKNISVTFKKNEVVSIIGPSGGGKSTFLRCLNLLEKPTSGQILIDGKKPSPETNAVLSYLPERIALSQWMKVTQVLDFFCDFYKDFDRQAAEQMLAQLHIAPNQVLKQMSKGTKEKIQLVVVMILCGDHHFGTFLAAFFQDLVLSLGKQITGVGLLFDLISGFAAGRILGLPVQYHLIQIL